jgi:transposase
VLPGFRATRGLDLSAICRRTIFPGSASFPKATFAASQLGRFRQTPLRHSVWLRAQLNKISGKTPLAKAIKYALTRLPKARPYLDHGFLELDNNTAERAVRPVTLGRKNYLFMGSEAGGKSAAIAYSLIETCKLNRVNPEAWLAWVLERIQDHPVSRVNELLPWEYQAIVDPQTAEAEAKNGA